MMETYHMRHPIDTKKTYRVDVFCKKWTGINGNSTFVVGGRYFITNGRALKAMESTATDFEEPEKKFETNRKKKEHCFKALKTRQEIIDKYKNIFYQRPNANTESDFKNICIKVRGSPTHGTRFMNRVKFTCLVVKNLQCKACKNICVYDALKQFYCMDSKCVSQVDRYVSQQ
ncbi:LEF-2 [Plodia interpunctella granulovirus]|uniref:LEF-2 n=1 Tax=Plodia interpunctella granulovirus TaxID=262175 RepID=A0A1L5JH29_9BBAC|nr:LEF-2 [Plodia interpunctella granulovirus]APO13918.1 LEF-2 [Plodia interpunctella granulovirus]